MREQEDKGHAEKRGSTTGQPNKSFEGMMNAITDSLSDVASSDDEEDGEDEAVDDEDTVQGKQSQCGKPGRVMCTVSKTIQQHM